MPEKNHSHTFVSVHDPQTGFSNKRYSAVNSNMQNHFELSICNVTASKKHFTSKNIIKTVTPALKLIFFVVLLCNQGRAL